MLKVTRTDRGENGVVFTFGLGMTPQRRREVARGFDERLGLRGSLELGTQGITSRGGGKRLDLWGNEWGTALVCRDDPRLEWRWIIVGLCGAATALAWKAGIFATFWLVTAILLAVLTLVVLAVALVRSSRESTAGARLCDLAVAHVEAACLASSPRALSPPPSQQQRR